MKTSCLLLSPTVTERPNSAKNTLIKLQLLPTEIIGKTNENMRSAKEIFLQMASHSSSVMFEFRRVDPFLYLAFSGERLSVFYHLSTLYYFCIFLFTPFYPLTSCQPVSSTVQRVVYCTDKLGERNYILKLMKKYPGKKNIFKNDVKDLLCRVFCLSDIAMEKLTSNVQRFFKRQRKI